jgi:DUF917 family protein
MSQVIAPSDLDALELGARLLGSGGAGDPRLARMLLEVELDRLGTLTVLDSHELDNGTPVISVGLAGSVTAFAEKPGRGDEFTRAFRAVAAFHGDRSPAISGYETAGINAFIPLLVAAQTGSPIVDIDGMGRGLSWLDQTTFDALGVAISPFVLVDPTGAEIIVRNMGGADGERFIRHNTVLMGGWSAFAGYRMDAATAQRVSVRGSLRRALTLGRALLRARASERARLTLVSVLCREVPDVRYLARGRIGEISWTHVHGYARGTLVIWSNSARPHPLRIEVSNEYLVVMEFGSVVARVPDLICLLDTRSGTPILAEQIGWGMEVDVLALPAPERWQRDGLWKRVNPEIYGLPMAASDGPDAPSGLSPTGLDGLS